MKIFFDKLSEMGYSVILKEHLTVSEKENSRGRERERVREREGLAKIKGQSIYVYFSKERGFLIV